MERLILEADFNSVGPKGALILPENAALRKLHDLVKIVGRQLFADHPDRQTSDELRLETVLDEILGADELKQLVIHQLARLGVETNLALSQAPRNLLLEPLECAAHHEQNMTGADRLPFRFPAPPLKFERGLKLSL